MMQKAIYLDYNSTSPIDPIVLDSMLPYLKEDFGNPSNTLHSYGWAAENAVTKASAQVASLLHCRPQEIIWNAGATEGNNSVVFGLIRKLKQQDSTSPIHLITSNAEHWSVLNSFAAAEKYEGVEVTYVPVNEEGVVTLSELKKHLRPHTKLISLIWINNEIGSINPIQEIAEFCQQHHIYFHTDATQAVGKVAINLQSTPIHFLTFSAHKFCGPKGVGVLIARSANPVEIEPYIFGGGQQHNRRSGTLNVPAIVGAGKACELCQAKMQDDAESSRRMLKKFWMQLSEKLPGVKLNGPALENRSPVNLSLLMPQMIDLVLPQLSRIAFSQGSACQSEETKSSHVLKAIRLTPVQAQCTMRLSIGRFTQQTDLDTALEVLLNAFKPNVTAKNQGLPTPQQG